jgi:hypothetical protein
MNLNIIAIVSQVHIVNTYKNLKHKVLVYRDSIYILTFVIKVYDDQLIVYYQEVHLILIYLISNV